MGTDDLHKKRRAIRKAKKENDLRRTQGKKDAYERITIICEGERTEIDYFSALREAFRLTSTKIKIVSVGTCPKRNVEEGIEILRQSEADLVFCVFDKDRHTLYEEALRLGESHEGLLIVNSVPSFEIWFLLHFIYTERPFYGSPARSAGDEVIKALKSYYPNYEKSNGKEFFEATKDALDKACQHACLLLQAVEKRESDDPSTRVHLAVEVLQKLRERMNS